MQATVTLMGPALDMQHAVRLIEDEFTGGPVDGVPGAWQWTSYREDIIDRAISHSMEFPDIKWDIEGSTVDGFTKELVEAHISDGRGTYRRTDFGRRNKRIPAGIDYDTVVYEYLLIDGQARLDRVVAKVTHDGEPSGTDVSHYFWRG